MKKFILISRMVQEQRYGRFLSYLLVNKSLEVAIKDPQIDWNYSLVTFE